MLRSGNPALKESTFLDLHSGNVVSPGNGTVVARDNGAMTLNGTANKTGILLMLTALTAVFAWSQSVSIDAAGNAMIAPGVAGYALGGLIGGFILALITIFKKEWSPITAPLYALVEGFFLGSISAMYEVRFNGIVLQAVLLTFGTLFAMLFAYRSGMIKATENFKLGVVAATGGIALVYLATMVLGFFNIQIPYIHASGTVGILFSLFVVVVAALNLVLDFDFIESGVEQGAPKYMEWYGAFGLMVTLVWLYLEFLRLLSKLQSRN
ncbi:Bax inhibitor-1/YccA family membrane protein [Xanthomonas sacchari]